MYEIIIRTRSQVYDATQNVMGLTPDTNCKCFALETRSSTKKMTNDAGTKLMENITEMACKTLIPTCLLH